MSTTLPAPQPQLVEVLFGAYLSFAELKTSLIETRPIKASFNSLQPIIGPRRPCVVRDHPAASASANHVLDSTHIGHDNAQYGCCQETGFN